MTLNFKIVESNKDPLNEIKEEFAEQYNKNTPCKMLKKQFKLSDNKYNRIVKECNEEGLIVKRKERRDEIKINHLIEDFVQLYNSGDPYYTTKEIIMELNISKHIYDKLRTRCRHDNLLIEPKNRYNRLSKKTCNTFIELYTKPCLKKVICEKMGINGYAYEKILKYCLNTGLLKEKRRREIFKNG